MADIKTTITAPGDIQKLREAVNTMDAHSQEAFEEIGAIARLALRSMTLPNEPRSFDDIATALKAICARADEAMNGINCEAESVGCNYVTAPKSTPPELNGPVATAKAGKKAQAPTVSKPLAMEV
jgi:hypothetical protein